MTYDDGSYDASPEDRLLAPEAGSEEAALESALRPRTLDTFIGQQRVKDQLGLVLEAATARGRAADHVLLAGPPGLGKTTLSMIIAAELGMPLRVTSGPALQHAGDLAAVLSSLVPGEVLFLDEIHRMSRAAEEMLYLAMEDFRVDIIVGKGPGAISSRTSSPSSASIVPNRPAVVMTRAPGASWDRTAAAPACRARAGRSTRK
jgi:holliday junction DNA helicase RuvB